MNTLPVPESLWQEFITREQLTAHQATQFEQYALLLQQWNDQMNLTAITDPKNIVKDHFQDSLSVTHCVNINEYKGMCDVGAGAGFPGIPLKIKYPDLPLCLIEVNKKKITFLDTVCQKLGLDVTLYDLDWRTFLRKTDFNLDFFMARASLQPEELVRMFKPSSPYRHAQLVYWASKDWQPSAQVSTHIIKTEAYKIGSKNRQLIFMQQSKAG